LDLNDKGSEYVNICKIDSGTNSATFEGIFKQHYMVPMYHMKDTNTSLTCKECITYIYYYNYVYTSFRTIIQDKIWPPYNDDNNWTHI